MKFKHLFFLVLFFAPGIMVTAQNPYLQGTKQGGAGVPGTNSRSPLNSLERAGTGADPIPGATILTDTFGNQRFSLYVYVLDTCILTTPTPTGNTTNLNSFVNKCTTDSTWYIDWTGRSILLDAGGGNQNWYTVDDTTTENSRTAYIKQNAYWFGVDVNGQIYMQMGDNSVSVMDLTQDYAHIVHNDIAGQQLISANTTGIDLETTASSTRAVDIYTDTINWRGSFDQTKLLIHYLSLENCMYADSNTVVVLGQFSPFQSLQLDGTEKGFYYEPGDEGVMMINGNGTKGAISQQTLTESAVTSYAQSDAVNTSYGTIETSAVLDQSIIKIEANHILSPFSDNGFRVIAGDPGGSENLIGAIQLARDTNVSGSLYFGKSDISSIFYEGARAFGVRTWPDEAPFDWIQTYLPNDTAGIQVSFYNRKYYFANDTPYVAVGDTSFHFWAGDGVTGGKHPGFMKLTDVRGPGGGENWYTEDNTTTDALRTATILEAAEWVGDDADGYLYWEMGSVAGGRLLVSADSSRLFYTDVGGTNEVSAGPSGVKMTTIATDGITHSAPQVNFSPVGSTSQRWNLLSGTGTNITPNGQSIRIFNTGLNPYLRRQPLSGTVAFFDRYVINNDSLDLFYATGDFALQSIGADLAIISDERLLIDGDSITMSDVEIVPALKWVNGQTTGGVLKGIQGSAEGDFIGWDDVSEHWEVRAASTVPNWYNTDGTTTDNTRIADVTQKAIWRSDDVTADGIYPFVFELDNTGENEPEMMTWKFPADSLNLYQSDVEITFHSNTALLNRADGYYAEWADSVLTSLGGVTSWKVGRYNTITQFSNESGGGNNQSPILSTSITGTAQTELFLDGSSAVLRMPASSISNFDIQVSAICTAAGNGVGITTGDAWSSWHVGGIKRIVNATSLVGTVQTTATAQADAGMSTSVVTIDADDTDESLRIRFTPPSTAGSTSTFKVIATISLTQTTY